MTDYISSTFKALFFCILCTAAVLPTFSYAGQTPSVYTDFERDVESAFQQEKSNEGYLKQIDILAEKYKPLSASEKAYTSYLQCTLTPNDNSIPKLDNSPQAQNLDFQIAAYLCQQHEHELAERSDKAFENLFLAYRRQDKASSAPLRYIVADLYADSSVKKGLFAEGVKATRVMLDIALTNKLKYKISRSYSRRALLQAELKQFEKAIDNIEKSIETAETHYDRTNRELDKGYILSFAQQNEEAISVYNDITSDPRNAEDDVLKIIVWSNLSYIYSNTQQVAKNLKLTEKYLNLAQQIDEPLYIAQAQMSRAYALLDTGRYKSAIELFEKADKWFLDNNYDVRTAEGYREWAGLLYEQDRFKEAYSYLEKSVNLYKQIEEDNGNSEIETIEAVLDAEAKQRKLTEARLSINLMDEKQKAQTKLIIVIMTSAILILVLGIYSYLRLKRLHDKLDVANSALEYENSRDPLTGAFNRRFFYRFLEDEKLKPEASRALIALIDIDHFKSLNDTYGHDVGDQVLQIVVKRLKSTTKQSDKVVRWGGEEFLIYLSVNDSIEQTRTALLRIVNEINSNPLNINQEILPVTISMGFKVIELTSDVQAEVKEIDNYLYRAKDEGRKRAVGMFSPELPVEVL